MVKQSRNCRRNHPCGSLSNQLKLTAVITTGTYESKCLFIIHKELQKHSAGSIAIINAHHYVLAIVLHKNVFQ